MVPEERRALQQVGSSVINVLDFASLLKALNDAVGSSIKLPPNGARTLKLCLSVGQDGGMTSLQEPQSQQLSHRDTSTDCFGSSNKNNSINYFNNSKKNNVSVVAEHTSNVALRAPEGRRNRGLAPPQKAREFSKLNNLTGSAADEQTHQKQQVKRTNETRNQPGRVASLPSAIQLAPPPSVCSTSGLRDRVLFISAGLPHAGSSTKAALKGTEHTPAVLSSVQNRAQATCSAQVMTEHKRLADLVRENMERNRVRQQHR
ncbi:naked cuticle-like protein 1 [Plakobranchus ocellatus]|uniref:Naked cuticle-like protein 1 n=1 Tax=Plakobranchus ocellatus TaxID=259542 RepID=A0AAV3ZLN3_9GAST|nr:naked cuticle-like protein 1 [Plakobranchus ocellatus]